MKFAPLLCRGGSIAVAITRLELGPRELRREAARYGNGPAARWLLALALVLEGRSQAEAARSAGMDRQTLRDWVHRYDEGLSGLYDRVSAGPEPRLSPAQQAELAAIVEAGPDPTVDGDLRWRRVDLQNVIARRFGVHQHERAAIYFRLAGVLARHFRFRSRRQSPPG
jgi:transposase